MKLSDKPAWVDIMERGTDEVLLFCHRCGKESIFEGSMPQGGNYERIYD